MNVIEDDDNVYYIPGVGVTIVNGVVSVSIGSTSTTVSAGNHDHDEDYAAIDHNHDEDYAAIDHNHDEDYAPIDHDHGDYYDLRYAPIIHEHDEQYADLYHDHGDEYAAAEHEHSWEDISDAPAIGTSYSDISSVSDEIVTGAAIYNYIENRLESFTGNSSNSSNNSNTNNNNNNTVTASINNLTGVSTYGAHIGSILIFDGVTWAPNSNFEVSISYPTNGDVLFYSYDSGTERGTWRNGALYLSSLYDVADGVNTGNGGFLYEISGVWERLVIDDTLSVTYDSNDEVYKLSVVGNNNNQSGSLSLNNLPDVSVSSPSPGDVLQYNSQANNGNGQWVSGPVSLAVQDLSDVSDVSPTDGSVLVYSSSANRGLGGWEPAPVSAAVSGSSNNYLETTIPVNTSGYVNLISLHADDLIFGILCLLPIGGYTTGIIVAEVYASGSYADINIWDNKSVGVQVDNGYLQVMPPDTSNAWKVGFHYTLYRAPVNQ